MLDVFDFFFVGDKIVEYGLFDILVNNVGINCFMLFWDVIEVDYDVVLDLNLKLVFFVV